MWALGWHRRAGGGLG
ncbi:hypothetical protein CVT26_012513 [Gymnopilus dilepis]|uniref:Uncharacterized protein n=1 Tax=Gymnopilus dilepis TaxID=231916 RepID=A0A409YW42_9AGAR|nr:hypothetical protein CVT26_012513 [Gymnopilus dilepis]